MDSYLIDTHAHLDMLGAGPGAVDGILEEAFNAGVAQVITIGIDLETSKVAATLAEHYRNVFAGVGVHPHDAAKTDEKTWDRLQDIAGSEKVVAWGEIGLDYARLYSPEDVQKQVFGHQLDIAAAMGIPVIIHDRDAHDDTMQILKPFAQKGLKGVFHCYSGDREMARMVLDMGFYISITGVVTFKNAAELRDVVAFVPLDRIMVETDSPFLSPVPFRGKRNAPARVKIVAEKIAEIKSVPIKEVARCTSSNARALFGLPLP